MKTNLLTAIFRVFLILSLPVLTIGQHKYVFEYDKLTNEFSYYESIIKEGKSELIEIKKPKLADGDLYTIKAINVNELVFDLEILESYVYQPEENVLGNIIGGVQPLLGGLGGRLGTIVGQLSDMTYDRPGSIMGRGGAGNAEMVTFMEQYDEVLGEIEYLTKELKKFSDIESEVIFSETKTIEQIKKEFDEFSNTFSIDSLNSHLDHALYLTYQMDLNLDKIKEMDSELAVQFVESKSEIEAINNSVFNSDFLGNSYLLEMYRDRLDELDFEISETYVSGYESITEEEVEEVGWEWKSGRYYSNEVVEMTEYLLMFTYLNDTSETNFNGTQLTKHVSFRHKGVNLPKWTTGFIVVSPFQQQYDYEVVEGGRWGDSLMIQSNALDKNLFSLGTFLSYEFYNRTNFIPSVNGGVGLGFLDEDRGKISFNLGAGLKFAKIPFLSITGGMSWSQSAQLKNGYSSDTWFTTPDNLLDEYGDLDPYAYDGEIFETKFKPGYFFGITLNL